MPYPSTFASGVTLLLLAARARRSDGASPGGVLGLALTAGLGAVVLLVHPLTFIVLLGGLAAFQIHLQGGARGALALVITLACAFLIAASWSYFPVLDLLLREATAFHPGNDVFYDDPLPKIWPALFGLPVLALRLSRDLRDPLALLFGALALVYAFGDATRAWSYGRVVAFVVLVLHVALADALAGWLDSVRPAKRALLAAGGAALLVLPAWRAWLEPVVREAREAKLGHGPWLEFLRERVAADEVVLTPPDYSWYVPVFAGKLVAYPHRLAFIPDQDERSADVARYFSQSATVYERRSILARRGVAAVLLPKLWLPEWKRYAEELLGDGAVTVYESDEYVLLHLRPLGGAWPRDR